MNRTLTRRLRHQRHTLVLLIIALLALALLIALAPLTRINYWGIDIYTFRAGAKAMALGENPYDEPNILRFADGVTVGIIHNFVYAPFFGFLLRPLAWLEPTVASRLWFACNLVFYFVSITLLIKAIQWQPASDKLLPTLIALVAYPPLRTTLVIGQNTLFLLFWFSLSYFLLKRSYPWLSGLSFSLALFKPHLAPLLLFYWLKRQWRLLAGFVLGILLTTLPFWGYLDDWFRSGSSAYNLNVNGEGCFRLVSLTAVVQCFVPPGGWQIALIAILVLLIIGLVLPRFGQNREPDDPAFDRHVALAVVIILLLLDNVRIADQMLLVVPMLVIWRDWSLLKKGWTRRFAIALMMVIYVVPYAVDMFQSRNIAFILPLWYLALSVAVGGLLLLQSSHLPQQLAQQK